MLQIKRILYATDGSRSADQAYSNAREIARLHESHIDIVYVEEQAEAAGEEPAIHREQLPGAPDAAKQDVERFSIEQWRVEAQSAADGILFFAEERDVDLVVLGTHGRRGVRRMLIGSVAEEVVRLSPCPVLTTRLQPQPCLLKGAASVLAPVDFSEHSRLLLRHAAELARTLDARLDVLHIIEQRAMPNVYDVGLASLSLENLKKRAREGMKQLVEEECDYDRFEIEVKTGYPPEDIAERSEVYENGLITISSHGRTGMKRMLLGSVAEKVVRLASCPVFTVKSYGKSLVAAHSASEAA